MGKFNAPAIAAIFGNIDPVRDIGRVAVDIDIEGMPKLVVQDESPSGKNAVSGEKISLADVLPLSLANGIKRGTQAVVTSYLNAAIEKCRGRKTTLFIPAAAAPYLVDNSNIIGGLSTLRLPPGVNIEMEVGAWLKRAPGETRGIQGFIACEGDNIVQVNIDGDEYPGSMTGDWGPALCYGVFGRNADNVRIVNSQFRNLTYAVRGESVSKWTIENIHCYRTRFSAVLISSAAGEASSHNKIVNSRFEQAGDTAVAFQSTAATAIISFNLIMGCTAIDTQHRTLGYAFDVEGGFAFGSCFCNMFIGNTVIQTTPTAYPQGGITMNLFSERSVIALNTLIGNYSAGAIGIDIDGTSRIRVLGNTVEKFRRGGLRCDDSSGAKILMCEFHNCGDGTAGGNLNSAIVLAYTLGNNDTTVSEVDLSWDRDFPYAGPQMAAVIVNAGNLAKPVTNLSLKSIRIKNRPSYGVLIRGYGDVGGFAKLIKRVVIEDIYITSDDLAGFDQNEPIEATYVTGLSVQGNRAFEVERGFNFTGSTHAEVKNNTIENIATNPTLPFFVNWTGVTDSALIDNQFNATATNPVLGVEQLVDPTKNNRVRGNRGIKTEAGGKAAAVSSGGTIAHGLISPPAVVTAAAASGEVYDLQVSGVGANDITLTFTGGTPEDFNWTAAVQ